MALRRRNARAPREPLYWERVCGSSNWGFGLDDTDPTFDCEAAEVKSGLVLASGEQSALGVSADQQTTVRRIIWPTILYVAQSFASNRQVAVFILVIKTSKVVNDFLGTSLTDLLNEEDVLDGRALGFSSIPGAVTPAVNPDIDRRWEVNVMRKLQTTENVIALAGPAALSTAIPAGNTMSIQLATPLLSVLLQRTMRRR